MKPSPYVTEHYVALNLLGVAISVAMFLWDRRRK